MRNMTDEFRAYNAAKKEKKADNLVKSTKLFIDNDIDYESKNNGIHLIVTDFQGELIDFYPSTGKWIPRGSKSSRGVMNLLRYIKNKTD